MTYFRADQKIANIRTTLVVRVNGNNALGCVAIADGIGPAYCIAHLTLLADADPNREGIWPISANDASIRTILSRLWVRYYQIFPFFPTFCDRHGQSMGRLREISTVNTEFSWRTLDCPS